MVINLHNYGKIHHAIHGKIHYFYGHGFKSYLIVCLPGRIIFDVMYHEKTLTPWISVQYTHDGSLLAANIKGFFVDGIHRTPYIAAPFGSVMGFNDVDITMATLHISIPIYSLDIFRYMGLSENVGLIFPMK